MTVNGHRYPEPPVALFLAPSDYEVTAEFPTGVKTMSVQIRTGKTTSVTFEPVAPPMVPLENALSAEIIDKGLDAAPPPGPSKLRIASYAVSAPGSRPSSAASRWASRPQDARGPAAAFEREIR